MATAGGLIEVRGACPHDCPDNCAWIASVEDGVVTGVRGNPDHPITAGHLCLKVQKYEERAYHPDRLLAPLVRTGPKGSATFREATWPEALRVAGDGLRAAADRGGPTSVMPWSYMGTSGALQGGPSMDARFGNAFGAASMLGTICFAAGATAWGMTYGGWPAADIEDAVHARSVVAWGANMVSTHLHLWKLFLDARKQGATIVCVDPVRTRTAKAADVHLPLRPGSDAALALGAMHVLFAEGFADDAFLDAHTEGADALRARAAEWPLERAAHATGLTASDIEAFARLLGEGPTFVKVGPGAQRHRSAGEGVRAAILLPAVNGSWGKPGGGALVHSAGGFAHPGAAMGMPELRGGQATRDINMIHLGRALAGTLDGEPPLTGLIVHTGNPAVVAPDSNAVRAGLSRDDLFVVGIEQFMTESMRYADVIFPATTQLEHLDAIWSWGHYYLALNHPAIEPRGQSRPNTEVFRLLAAEMAEHDDRFDHKAFADDDDTLLATYLAAYPDDIVARLRDVGFAKMKVVNPTGAKIKIASERMAAPDGRDPEPDDGRLVLVTPKSHHFLNSTFVNHARLAHMASGPTVHLTATDAARLGVVDGASVRLRTEHGEITVAAEISDAVVDGTAMVLSNWWHSSFTGGAGVNTLTGQDVADLAGAPIFSARVEVLPA